MDNWFSQVMRCFSLESTLQKKEEELVLLADTITLKCGSEEGAKNSLQYFAKKEELVKKNIELADSFLGKGRKIYPYKLLLLEKGGNEIDVAEGFRISEETKKKNPRTMRLLGGEAKETGERVLCGGCNKPIKLNEVGVVTKGRFYHNRLPCMMTYLESKKEAEK